MKRLNKILCMAGTMSLLVSGLAYAETEAAYPDCVVYDYETGEETIIPAEEFMNVTNARTNDTGEQISPAYDISPDSRTIIGPDNRVKVDPNQEPYCKILCLNLGRDTNGDGVSDSWALGTGFMVYKDIMLTAGHCMYNSTGYVKEMRIYVKQSGQSLGSKYYYPANWVMSQAYINNPNDANYDWCVVKLQNELGPQTGWFGYGVANSQKNVTVSGYPDNTAHHYNQYAASGTMTVSNDLRVAHNCDTEGGESGAPIYDAAHIAWGIHTHGGNAGIRINSYLYNLIESKK